MKAIVLVLTLLLVVEGVTRKKTSSKLRSKGSQGGGRSGGDGSVGDGSGGDGSVMSYGDGSDGNYGDGSGGDGSLGSNGRSSSGGGSGGGGSGGGGSGGGGPGGEGSGGSGSISGGSGDGGNVGGEGSDQIPPGYEGGNWVMRPDGTAVMEMEVTSAPIEYQEEVAPSYNPEIKPVGQPGSPNYYDIVGIGEPGQRGYFKRTPGASGNPDDYNLDPIVSPDNPVPVNPADKNSPKVHRPKGRIPTMQIGTGNNAKYYRLESDPKKPGSYKVRPQSMNPPVKKPSVKPVEPPVTEPLPEIEPPSTDNALSPEEYEKLKQDPQINKKGKNPILSLGQPNHRRHFKIEQNEKNPYDFDVKPIGSQDDPDSQPDINDPEAPEVLPQGSNGQPDHSVILGVGPKNDRKYVRMLPNQENPGEYNFEPVLMGPSEPINSQPELEPEQEPEANPEPETGSSSELPAISVPEDEYERLKQNPQIKKNGRNKILSLGRPEARRFFKIKPNRKNPYDFDVEPIGMADDPNSKPDPNDPEKPEIHPLGKKGQPGYKVVFGVGPKKDRKYVQMTPDPKKPGNYEFSPVLLAPGQSFVAQTDEPTEATEPEPETTPEPTTTIQPEEEERCFDDLPENPIFRNIRRPGGKQPYQIISVGPNNHRQHFKKTPRSNNPNDYDLEPYDPNTSNHKPDPKDPYAPEVIPQGKKGTPKYSPVINTGSKDSRVPYRLVPHPDNPKDSGFIPVMNINDDDKHPNFVDLPRKTRPRKHNEPTDDTPEDDEPNFDDLPENPEFRHIKKPGVKRPYTLISVGIPPNRRTFKKTPGSSALPDDYVLEPYDENTPNHQPDPHDPSGLKVYPNGKPKNPGYSPVIEIGPINNRKTFRVTPHPTNPNKVGFIPVKKLQKNKKKPSFRDLPRKVHQNRFHPIKTEKPHEGDDIFDDLPFNPEIRPRHRPGQKYPSQVIALGKPPHRKYFEKKPKPENPQKYDLVPYNPRKPNEEPDPDDPDTPKVFPDDKGDDPVIQTGSPDKPKYYQVKQDPKNPENPEAIKFKPVKPSTEPGKDKPTFQDIPRQFHKYHTTSKPKRTTKQPNEGEPIFEDIPDDIEVNPLRKSGLKHPVQIISVGKPPHRQHFIKEPGTSNHPDDYKLKPYDPKKPDKQPDPLNEYTPDVYPAKGNPGKPGYQPPVIRIGSKKHPKYYELHPDPKDPKNPNKVKFVPVKLVPKNRKKPKHFEPILPRRFHPYHDPRKPKPTTQEPNDGDDIFVDGPDDPEVTTLPRPGQKYPSQLIAVGKPPNRKYFEKKPGTSGKPNDYVLLPIDPKHPDKKLDPKNPKTPKIFPGTGNPGTSKYQPPVIKTGSPKHPKFYRVETNPEDPNNPENVIFVPVKPVKKFDDKNPVFNKIPRLVHPFRTTKRHPKHKPDETPPPEDDTPYFVDVPYKPKIYRVKRPGDKRPIEILAVGKPPNRKYFEKRKKPGTKNQFTLHPYDPKKPDGKPDATDKTEVHPGQEKPGKPHYPVIEIPTEKGPKCFEVRPGPEFIPLEKLPGNNWKPIPRVTKIYHKTTKRSHKTTSEEPRPGNPVFTDGPHDPKIYTVPNKKQPFKILAVGKPPKRRFFKLVPGPKDTYTLTPYDPKHPNDKNPHPKDTKVFPNPEGDPVFQIPGPNNKPQFFRLCPNKKTPSGVEFIPVKPEKPNSPNFIDLKRITKIYHTTRRPKKITTTGPKEDDVIFVDVPEVTYTIYRRIPGKKIPSQLVVVGTKPNVKHFEKVPSDSGDPNQFTLIPIDIFHPNKPVDPAKKIEFPCPDGKDTVIEGPDHKFYKIVPNKKNPKILVFTPVEKTPGTDQFEPVPRIWYRYHTTPNPEIELLGIQTTPTFESEETDPDHGFIQTVTPEIEMEVSEETSSTDEKQTEPDSSEGTTLAPQVSTTEEEETTTPEEVVQEEYTPGIQKPVKQSTPEISEGTSVEHEETTPKDVDQVCWIKFNDCKSKITA